MVEAKEMGKATQALVSGSGGACRLSEHQRNKQSGRQQHRAQQSNSSQHSGNGARGSGGKSCGFCGRGSHDRDKCPAKDIVCHKCKKTGHFWDKCRQKDSGKKVAGLDSGKSEEPAAVVSTIQGTGDSIEVEEEFFGDCFLLSGVEADGW